MIYFVRHGEAAASWGDHPDPGLSDKGRAQAEQAAAALSAHPISHVFTSPMMRCQETAAPFVGASGLAATVEPRVTEIPTPDGIENRVDWLRGLMAGSWSAAPPAIADWHKALIEAVSTLPRHSVVFSHFVAINALVGHLEGDDRVTVFRPDHCSITTLDLSPDGVRLVSRGREAGTQVL